MTIPQQAIEAASRILSGEKEYYDTWDEARDILTAALPALEQQIREQVAQEIEALKLNPKDSTTPHCVEEYNAGLTNAARIARGKDQP